MHVRYLAATAEAHVRGKSDTSREEVGPRTMREQIQHLVAATELVMAEGATRETPQYVALNRVEAILLPPVLRLRACSPHTDNRL
jgi:hypothetical protein